MEASSSPIQEILDFITENKLNTAADHALRLLEREPENPAVLSTLAEISNRLEQYDNAQAFAESALELKPELDHARLQLAHAYLSRHILDEAEKELTRLLEALPNNPEIHHLLADTYYKKHDYNRAADHANFATVLDNQNADYLAQLAEIHIQLNDSDRAIELSEQAIALSPQSENAWKSMLKITVAIGDEQQYEKSISLAEKVIPDSPLINHYRAKWLMQQERHEEAEGILRQAIGQHPGYVENIHLLTRLFFKEEANREALEFAILALSTAPYHVDTLKNLALAYIKDDQHGAAIPWLDLALKADPNDYEIALYYGIALYFTNEYDAAIDIFQQMLEEKPGDLLSHLHISEILYAKGDIDGSFEHSQRCMELAPTSAKVIVNHCQLLIARGEMDEAKRLLEESIRTEVCDSGIFYTYSGLSKLENTDGIIERIDACATKEKMLSKREYYFFAASKILEREKDYDRSFDYLRQACDIHKQRYPHHTQATRTSFARTREIFSREFIEQYASCSNPSQTPIFILGMPRSGTTLVEQVISSHPEVFGAGELSYIDTFAMEHSAKHEGLFIDSLRELDCEEIDQFSNYYLERLKQRSGGGYAHVTDKMPGNYRYIGLIQILFPNAPIIHCRRDPIDTCLSCYKHNFTFGHRYSYDLEQVADLFLDYRKLMAHWDTVLPAGRIYPLYYQRLIDNFDEEARKLIAHCGLEWDDRCLEFHKSKRSVITASTTQVRQPIYTSGVRYWKRYEKHLSPLIDKLGNLED